MLDRYHVSSVKCDLLIANGHISVKELLENASYVPPYTRRYSKSLRNSQDTSDTSDGVASDARQRSMHTISKQHCYSASTGRSNAEASDAPVHRRNLSSYGVVWPSVQWVFLSRVTLSPLQLGIWHNRNRHFIFLKASNTPLYPSNFTSFANMPTPPCVHHHCACMLAFHKYFLQRS